MYMFVLYLVVDDEFYFISTSSKLNHGTVIPWLRHNYSSSSLMLLKKEVGTDWLLVIPINGNSYSTHYNIMTVMRKGDAVKLE